MTKEEKEQICQLLASLSSSPDEEIVRQAHQGSVHSFFQRYVQSWEGDVSILKGFLVEGDPDILLRELGDEYDRLFSGVSGEGASMVESVYKQWTHDPFCSLPFASEKGLLMGDSALHLSEIYRLCGLEVDEDFKGCPDHLILELEFLSYLYRRATDAEIWRFIEDHLDWLSLFKEELTKLHPHPYYRSLLEVLSLFLNEERKRLEMRGNG